MNSFDRPSTDDYARRDAFEHSDAAQQSEEIAVSYDRAAVENGPTLRAELDRENDPQMQQMLEKALAVSEAVKDAGGLALAVGGYPRDMVFRRMGRDVKSKDIDLEVYGLTPEVLQQLVESQGEINTVGKQFEVIKLRVGETYLDVSMPRRDSKQGPRHQDFNVQVDTQMSVEEASRRRDFTVNAMALNPLTGEIVDKHGGLEDMQHGVLRAVDTRTFVEDPLRVLRAMQFAARFGFRVDPATAELCRRIDLSHLPKERVGDEWKKLLLKSEQPSIGMEVARELKVIEKLHPELSALIGAEQDPGFHPEGDVWTHTKEAVDRAAAAARERKLDPEEALIVILGGLCHDLGKPYTKAVNDEGRITHHGHADAGVPYAKSLMSSLNVPGTIVDRVLPLVKEHMSMLTTADLTDKAVRRLADRLSPATIEDLVAVSEADSPVGGKLDRTALLRRAEEMTISKHRPEPILHGRDLIDIGFAPGKRMGEVLRAVQQAFLDGEITTKEQALDMAEHIFDRE